MNNNDTTLVMNVQSLAQKLGIVLGSPLPAPVAPVAKVAKKQKKQKKQPVVYMLPAGANVISVNNGDYPAKFRYGVDNHRYVFEGLSNTTIEHKKSQTGQVLEGAPVYRLGKTARGIGGVPFFALGYGITGEPCLLRVSGELVGMDPMGNPLAGAVPLEDAPLADEPVSPLGEPVSPLANDFYLCGMVRQTKHAVNHVLVLAIDGRHVEVTHEGGLTWLYMEGNAIPSYKVVEVLRIAGFRLSTRRSNEKVTAWMFDGLLPGGAVAQRLSAATGLVESGNWEI